MPAAACEVSPASMGGRGDGKKGGGKGKGKGEGKGEGKGKGKGKGRGWSPPREEEEEEGHLGPLQLPGDGSGQLTPEDRQAIKEATGVSAAVRYRDSWGMRMLTLAGPPDNLSEARRMATARLVASQQARPTEAEKLADLTERLGAAELKLTALQHQVSYLVSTSPGMQMYPVATVPHVPAPPAHRHGHRRRRSSTSSREARHRRRASSSPSRSRDRDGSSTSPADRPAKPAELSAEARPAKDELPPGLPTQKVKCEEPDEALEEGRAESKSAEESSSSSPKAAAEAKTAAAKAPSKPAEKLPPRAAPFPTGLGQGGLKRESSPSLQASQPVELSARPPASLPTEPKAEQQEDKDTEKAASPPAKRCKEELQPAVAAPEVCELGEAFPP